MIDHKQKVYNIESKIETQKYNIQILFISENNTFSLVERKKFC
jgi:hypothetical protein